MNISKSRQCKLMVADGQMIEGYLQGLYTHDKKREQQGFIEGNADTEVILRH